MARCPSCKAPIGRVQTTRGNEMPVESGAVKIQAHIPDTPVLQIITPRGEMEKGTLVNAADVVFLESKGIELTAGFIPHWGNCTEPDKYRKKK